MKPNFQPTGDLTDLQLWERERSLRVMASTALSLAELTTLLGLAEQYESLVTGRQVPEAGKRC
jgi:hypothetical protein